jgi:hypothetical protein
MTIFVCLLFCFNGLQSQTTQPKLNQLKLAEDLWIGTFQRIDKDTVYVAECQQYGKVFVENLYSVIKGKKSLQIIYNHVYSSEEDKFNVFVIYTDGYYDTWIGKFTNEKKYSLDIVQNFNPEKAQGKAEAIFDQQKNMTAIFYNISGAKTGEYKWVKVK